MRDVEESGSGADGHVLVDDARVFHGHVPAAELDHAGAEGAVPRVQWGFLQSAGRGLCHGRGGMRITFERYYAAAIFGKRPIQDPRGFAPRTPLQPHSLAASPARFRLRLGYGETSPKRFARRRAVRLAHSLRSFASSVRASPSGILAFDGSGRCCSRLLELALRSEGLRP